MGNIQNGLGNLVGGFGTYDDGRVNPLVGPHYKLYQNNANVPRQGAVNSYMKVANSPGSGRVTYNGIAVTPVANPYIKFDNDPGLGIGLGGLNVPPSEWDIKSDAYLNAPPQNILEDEEVVINTAGTPQVITTPNSKTVVSPKKTKVVKAKVPNSKDKSVPVKKTTKISAYNIMDTDKQSDDYGINW
jgi:hypothetical protein